MAFVYSEMSTIFPPTVLHCLISWRFCCQEITSKWHFYSVEFYIKPIGQSKFNKVLQWFLIFFIKNKMFSPLLSQLWSYWNLGLLALLYFYYEIFPTYRKGRSNFLSKSMLLLYTRPIIIRTTIICKFLLLNGHWLSQFDVVVVGIIPSITIKKVRVSFH